MQLQTFNPDQVVDQKAIDYMEIKNQTLQQTIMDDPKIARYLEFADYLFTFHFQQTLNNKEHEKLLIETFNIEYILSKLYGLELHKIKENFIKFGNKLKVAAFVMLLLELIQFQPEEVPYMINGLRELAEKIAINDIITFEQFLQYYMSCEEIEEDQNTQLAHYKLKECKNQDSLYHRHEIQKAIYAKALQKIVLLEENQPTLLLLGMDFSLWKSIQLEENAIILDFDYSEQIKEFCCSLSNNKIVFLSFLDQLHNKKISQCDYLLIKIQFMQLLNQWVSVTTNQQLILWTYKSNIQTKIIIQLQGGKIQSIVELLKNEMICVQTDLKRIHLFNTKFEQLIRIQDTLLIQSMLFSERSQCFYSINFTHKIQKWLIEEHGVDYTKDKSIQICKPEYTVLAIGFVQDLLVSYDSSNFIRVFETEEFKKLATFKKILKPTQRMKIIEIYKYQFIIVGNRLTQFEIEVIKEDKHNINIIEKIKQVEDFEKQMKKTQKLISSILKLQPKDNNFRGTKHQDQIETILEQIKGAKSQLLPKIKVKEKKIYSEITDEYIKEAIEQVDKTIYANKLLKERIHKATEPFVEIEQQLIEPKILQSLSHLQEGLEKIDHQINSSNQGNNKFNQIKMNNHNNLEQDSFMKYIKYLKKPEIFKEFNFVEQSIKNKMDPLLKTEENLLSQRSHDYLNKQQKKKNTNSLLNYQTRYEYFQQRGRLKKELFQTQFKSQGQFKYISSPFDTNNSVPLLHQLNTPKKSLTTINTTQQIKEITPLPLPNNCKKQMEKVNFFYNEAVKAINFIQEQSHFMK